MFDVRSVLAARFPSCSSRSHGLDDGLPGVMFLGMSLGGLPSAVAVLALTIGWMFAVKYLLLNVALALCWCLPFHGDCTKVKLFALGVAFLLALASGRV